VGNWDLAHDVGRNPSLCHPWRVPPADEPLRLQGWGFSAVLLHISWANVERRAPTYRGKIPIHHYNRRYLRALDRVVASFADRGIKVILVMANNRWSSAFTDMVLPNGSRVPCGFGMPAWLYPRGGGIDQMVRAEKAFFSGDAPS